MPVPLGPTAFPPGRTRTLATSPDGALVRRTLLPNGMRVISESVPGVRSVAFGAWVGVGSRDETPARAGASHYLEHLLFKGTPRRDALAISAALDAVGGELNAFTTKEYTCYYARVLDRDLPLAVDVITDMVTSSLLRPADVESERTVILEEIAMHDDEPADAVHDQLAAAVWGGALGRPVLGTPESIGAISRRAIAGHYRRRYRPPELVVAAAGHVEHARLLRELRAALERAGWGGGEAEPVAPRRGAARPGFRPGVRVDPRPTEQANLLLAAPALASDDPRRFALAVLNAAFGGGMSSRLFTEIRERRGLAYSVYSFAEHYADTGLFGIYAGCQPRRADEVVCIAREQLAELAGHGLTAEELDRGKGQLAGALALGMEDTGSRMTRLGKSELVYGELLTFEEVLAHIDAVRLEDVAALAAELAGGPLTLAAIGPFADHDFTGALAS